MKEVKKQKYMAVPWFTSGSANLGFQLAGSPTAPRESTRSSKHRQRSARLTSNADTAGPTGATNEDKPRCLAQPASTGYTSVPVLNSISAKVKAYA